MKRLLLAFLFPLALSAQISYVPTCLTPAQQATLISTSAADAPLLGFDPTDLKMKFADQRCASVALTTGVLSDIATLKAQVAALTPPPVGVTVQNPSFETTNPLTLSGPGIYNHGPIPNWTGTGGSWQPSTAAFASVPNGVTVAFTNGPLTQDLGVTPQAGRTYVLKVSTGLRKDPGGAADAAASWSIALYAGATQLCSITGPNSAIPLGTFVQQTLNCTILASPPAGDLIIQLSASGGEAVFDNVTLE